MPVIAGTEKLLVSDTAGSKVTLPEQSPGDSPSEIVSNVVDDDVLKQLLQRIDKAEFRVLTMLDSSKDDPVDRVKKDLSKKNVFSSVLVKVAANYYEKSLLERAKTLNCFVSQLCKSIIFENTAWYGESDIDDPTNSRYYLVLVQYEGRS